MTSNQATSHKNNAVLGAVLVALGVIFLLRMTGLSGWMHHILPQNWWALFLLVPGGIMLYRGWQAVQAGQGAERTVRTEVAGGVMMALMGIFFLFDLSFGLLMPVVLVGAGAWMLLRPVSAPAAGPAE